MGSLKDMLVVLLLSTVFCICSKHTYAFEITEDKIEISDFDVMPGGETLSVKRDWEEVKFSCNFTYQCQGGTKESWTMGMAVNNDNTKYSCTVQREGTSYLFFQTFRLEVYGGRVADVDVKGPSQSPLKAGEFILDEMTNSVSGGPKFQSMLGKVVLYAVKPKEEL